MESAHPDARLLKREPSARSLLRMTTTKRLACFLPFLLSCYQPDFSRTYLRCDAQNANRCPDGLSCVEGYCGPPFPLHLSAPGARSDMASAAPVDMAGPWYGVTRASLPACTVSVSEGNGYLLRPKLAACLSFGQNIRSACKAPWSLCGAWPLPREECRSLPWGFFGSAVSSLQANDPPPAEGNCDVWGNPTANVRLLFGCGTSRVTPTFDANGACRNLYRLVPVASRAGQPSTWWSSPTTSDPGYAVPADPLDGALCCAP